MSASMHFVVNSRSVRFGPPLFQWRCTEAPCEAEGSHWSVWGDAYRTASMQATAHYYREHYTLPKAVNDAMARIVESVSAMTKVKP